MKYLMVMLLFLPLNLNAQMDEAKLGHVVGFKNQAGVQLGVLDLHGYIERSIGSSWTYRIDLGYDAQIQGLGQNDQGRSFQLLPSTSAELRHYWSTKKESASTFVSLKGERRWNGNSEWEQSEDMSIQQNETLSSFLVGRNKNIGLRGRAEVGCGVNFYHAPGDYFKVSMEPTLHLRLGLGW